MALRNVDSLLIKDNQERLEGLTPGSTKPFEDKPVIQSVQDKLEAQAEVTQPEESQTLEAPQESDNKQETNREQESTELKQETQPKEEVKATNQDEYGNEIKPPRTYTEEEVQSMIRDRLSRGRYAEQTPYQQPAAPISQQPQQSQQVDQEGSENWEQQLVDFIDRRLETKQQEEQRKAHEYQEAQIQAQFQDKFSAGMSKYHDFHEIVGNKPITDSMMLGTRGMTDPAAFIYAASKNHSEELARIAQLPDPFQQSAEIGKLEERMRKARNITSAGKPVSKVTSDMGTKQEPKKSIDGMILQDAKRKFGRR
jgi:hypothetical protein